MNRKTRSIRLIQAFGPLVLAGVCTLAVLQFRWISKASEAEHDNIVKNLRLSTSMVMEGVFDEIRTLVSYIYVYPEGSGGDLPAELHTSVQYWRKNSMFPKLLGQVYVLLPDQPESCQKYDAASASFQTETAPNELKPYMLKTEIDGNGRALAGFTENGFLLLPAYPRLDGIDPPGIFAAVKLDTGVLINQVLQYYMATYMPDYGYRVFEDNKMLFAVGIRESENPDLIVPFLMPTREFNRFRQSEAHAIAENPISRFWFLRTAGLPVPDFTSWPEQMRKLPSSRLEIFHPDRSIEKTTEIRRFLSITFSSSALVVLLFGYLFLYRSFSRAETLRTREREFLAAMSHELRTPLSVIRATSDNLTHGVISDPERIMKYGSLIKLQSERLGRMVESILLYSGIESGAPESFSFSEINLTEIVETICDTLQLSADNVGARIDKSIIAGSDIVVFDSDALRLIIENLLINALHHGVIPREGEKSLVRLEVRIQAPRTLQISVEDDGPGIPAKEQNSLFEPFVRGEASKKGQTPGSGLGLHLIKKIATHMGGTVTLESPYRDMANTERKGARFTVRIPLPEKDFHG